MKTNEGLSKEYKEFISKGKTERECVKLAVKMAEEKGYKNIDSYTKLVPGDKVYATNHAKSFVAFLMGNKSLAEGIRLLGAHIDSPRLDLKQHPFYEAGGLALAKTHYYGGIKKYQSVTLPMALHGVVCKKDGTVVEINIGEDVNDPVVGITDLLIHLAKEQMEKKAPKIIEGEELNVTLGSLPLKDTDKDPVKANVLKLLKDKYDIAESDFISAEIEVVPAGEARDYGLDRSMVMGYGQDDRVCAFTSLAALLELDKTDRTAGALLVDKEEIGSVGASSMHSRFFDDLLVKIMSMSEGYDELKMRQMYEHSDMLSSDVSAAFDPTFASVMEPMNAAYLGKGICLNKYVGSAGKAGTNDADPEYIARVVKAFEDDKVSYQTCELGKVDAGGGGTIAYIMANYNMNVIDCGVAVLSMHSPWEVTSKLDIYETYRAYVAFIKNI